MENPPFIIADLYTDPDFNNTNETLCFSLVLETDRYQFRHFVSFEELQEFAREHRKEDAAYFDSLRSNIPGLGPKLQVVRKMWIRDGYDIKPLVHSYLDATIDVEAEIQNQIENKWQTLVDKNSPDYKTSLELESEDDDEEDDDSDWLDDDAADMLDDETIRREKFQDALLEQANRLAVEIWPELLEREPKTIREMGEILVGSVEGLAEELTQLAYKKE